MFPRVCCWCLSWFAWSLVLSGVCRGMSHDVDDLFAGWEDGITEVLAGDREHQVVDAVADSSSAHPQRKKARPVGSTGSRMVRQQMQRLRAEEAEAEAETEDRAPSQLVPQADSNADSIKKLQEHRAMKDALQSMFGPWKFLLNEGSNFQRVVSQSLKDSVEKLSQTKDNMSLLKDTLGESISKSSLSQIVQGRALTCSATRVGKVGQQWRGLEQNIAAASYASGRGIGLGMFCFTLQCCAFVLHGGLQESCVAGCGCARLEAEAINVLLACTLRRNSKQSPSGKFAGELGPLVVVLLQVLLL